ncbi:MAG: DMT family transporter [Spirochaetales bacterium]|nr:DMT family transporter [Spirochaetales bacterium]
MTEHRGRAVFWVLVCVALWALIPVVSKLGQSRLDSHQFLFWSSLISFSVLFLTLVFQGKLKHLGRISVKDYIYLLFLGLLGTYIYYLFLYLGYAGSRGMLVLVLQYTWPVFIVLLSLVILKETLDWQRLFALAAGFAAVVIVLSGNSSDTVGSGFSILSLLVLLGAFCFALYSVLSKTVQQEPIIASTIYFFAALTASFVSLFVFSDFALPGGDEIVPVLLNGILVNGFSYLFWIFALRSASASFVAPFTFLTPVLSAVYLLLFFQEGFSPAYVAALVLVIAGGLVNTIRRN